MSPETAAVQQQPPAEAAAAKGIILLVDDDRVMLNILSCGIAKEGYEVVTARSGPEALSLIEMRGGDVDVIILDYEMPQMTGDDLMRILQQNPRFARIPVILQTGSEDPERVAQALSSGYFYYLTKPVNKALLDSVLAAALRESYLRKGLVGEIGHYQKAFAMVETARFRFRTLPEAECLALLMAAAFPDPQRAVIGLAELLINAVEHGNLEIGYAEKTKLLANQTWRDEVVRRADLPQHAGKTAEVLVQRKRDAVFMQITDAGAGFDWRSYLAIDPSRSASSHGRGIARARAQCFDDMRYNAAGNQVTVVTRLDAASKEAFEW